MSVLIKGMVMPKSDTMFTVTLRVRQDGTAEFISTSGKTVKSFPMIEIPTPHGRLIDAERLFNIFEPITSFPEDEQIMYVKAFLTAIKQAQTIIEAEVE